MTIGLLSHFLLLTSRFLLVPFKNEAVLPRQHALGVYQLQNLADLKGQETPNVAWLRAWFGEGLNARVVSMPEILFESAVDIVYSSEGQRSSLDSDVRFVYTRLWSSCERNVMDLELVRSVLPHQMIVWCRSQKNTVAGTQLTVISCLSKGPSTTTIP